MVVPYSAEQPLAALAKQYDYQWATTISMKVMLNKKHQLNFNSERLDEKH